MSYAKGKRAIAECMRSGQKMPYRDLVEDGHIKGMLVHPDWWEPKHPQETPPDVTDPIALYRPSPEISVPAGEGNPLAGNVCGTTPNILYQSSTTLSAALGDGAFNVPVETAVVYKFGSCVYIQRDDDSWFMSTLVGEADSPTYMLHMTTAFSGAASADSPVYVGATGSGVLA